MKRNERKPHIAVLFRTHLMLMFVSVNFNSICQLSTYNLGLTDRSPMPYIRAEQEMNHRYSYFKLTRVVVSRYSRSINGQISSRYLHMQHLLLNLLWRSTPDTMLRY